LLYKVAKAARKPQSHIPPLQCPNGTWARTDHEKASVLADYLATTFTPHDIPSPIVSNPQPIKGAQIDHFSPMEIKRMIAKMSPFKAPGMDSISARILKELTKKAYCRLAQIFNAITYRRIFRHYGKLLK